MSSMYSYYLHNRDVLAAYSTMPDDGLGFDDLLATIAAEHFPLNDDKSLNQETLPIAALSPLTISSGNSSVTPSPYTQSREIESDFDPDSDVEELVLQYPDPSGDYTRPRSRLFDAFEGDVPYMPDCTNPKSSGWKLKRQQQKTTKNAAYPPPVVALTSSRRLTSDPSHSSLFSADADGEPCDDFGGNGTDDEYIPSPALLPRKRQRASPSPRRRQKSAPAEQHSFPRDPHRPVKKPRTAPSSRNKQTASPATVASAADLSSVDFVCPICGWKQKNQRLPDFKRHLRTHTRSSDQDQSTGWWCKGVQLEEATRYGIPHTAEAYLFLDVWRVGGCQRTFARRDALKRHLDNPSVPCVGRPGLATDS